MNTMNILRVVPFPPEFLGGIQIYAKNLSTFLSNEFHIKSHILTSDLMKTQIKKRIVNQDVVIVYKKCFGYIWGKNPVVNIIPFLKRYYMKYDLIHAHGYYYFTSLQCALLKKLYNFHFVLHIHGGIQTPISSNMIIKEIMQLKFKKIFDKVVGRFIIKSADIIISVAKKDMSLIKDRYKINDEKCFYIPNGVDLQKFKKNDNIKRKYITLIATRLTYIKGVDLFLKIIENLFNKNKNLKFLIIGDGPLKNLVLNAKKRFPITYYPSYPYKNIQKIYNMSKILIITSRTEGVPNIIYESLACETPVISSNVGGINTVISHGKNGYLYEIKNFENSVELILDLINNHEKIQEFGKNGRILMEKEYSWEIITKKIFNIYRDFLK